MVRRGRGLQLEDTRGRGQAGAAGRTAVRTTLTHVRSSDLLPKFWLIHSNQRGEPSESSGTPSGPRAQIINPNLVSIKEQVALLPFF